MSETDDAQTSAGRGAQVATSPAAAAEAAANAAQSESDAGFDTAAELQGLRESIAGLSDKLGDLDREVDGLRNVSGAVVDLTEKVAGLKGGEIDDAGLVQIRGAISQIQAVCRVLARVASTRRMTGDDRRLLEEISGE